MNYLRFKESKIEPSVKNVSSNCALYKLKLIDTATAEQKSIVKNFEDVSEDMFAFRVLIENDVEHFKGTPYEGGGYKKDPNLVAKKTPTSTPKHTLATQAGSSNKPTSNTPTNKFGSASNTTSAQGQKPKAAMTAESMTKK